MAFPPVLAHCPAGFRAAAGLPWHKSTAYMGLCCPAGRQYSRQVFRTPGQGACQEDSISSGAGRLSGVLPSSGRIPRHKATAYMGLYCPAERRCGGRAFCILRARSVPGRWHFLRCWQTARRASGQRQDSPLYGQYRPKTNTPAAQVMPCGGGVFMYGNRTDQTSS